MLSQVIHRKLILLVFVLSVGFEKCACKTVPTPLLQVADLKNLMLNSYLEYANYTTPSDANLRLPESLFEKLLIVRDFSSHEVEAWSNLGLVLQVAYDALGQRYAVVSEAIRQGHGFYTVKLGEVTPSERLKFLQAPHRPSDTYTHEIVYDMLTLSHVFGAAGWSTTHRNVIDLCKEPKSYFNSFTTAIAKAIATPTIVQVHGFAKELSDVDVDVVFSSTKASMPPAFHPIADCIEGGLSPWTVLRYPEEVDFLGGTLNINELMEIGSFEPCCVEPFPFLECFAVVKRLPLPLPSFHCRYCV